MDTPGSDLSSDSSDSSADSPSADSTPAQIVQLAPSQDSVHAISSAVEHHDSDSDISMSAETDDEDDEAPRISAIQVNPVVQTLEEQPAPTAATDAEAETTNKRPYQESTDDATNGHIVNGSPELARKRLKPDDECQSLETLQGNLRQDKSLLPAEIWHHIFTFIPPRNLGLLLRVNKCFNAYLDASSSTPTITPLSRSASKLLKPDAIWRASRVLFRHGMASPSYRKVGARYVEIGLFLLMPVLWQEATTESPASDRSVASRPR